MPSPDAAPRSIRRVEDGPLITGRARFTEDLPSDGALHMVFVRSPFAHARLGAIDAAEALAMPGVVGVFTASDLSIRPMWGGGRMHEAFARPPLATDTVRFAGEAVAVVVAGTRAQALDAAEVVLVDYDPLPVLVEAARGLQDDAPLLFPEAGTNLARRPRPLEAGDGDPLAGADVVVRARLVNQRVVPAPMEPQAMVAEPDGDGGLVVRLPNQGPFFVRSELAEALDAPEERIRVITPWVGGAFGARIFTYPEHAVTAAVALRLGRPVRYVETRSESTQSMTHGRSQVQDVELGATRDGTLTGIRVRVIADSGAYPGANLDQPAGTRLMITGAYRIARAEFAADVVVTNTSPVAAYRGAGRPEATALLERAVDMVAAELEMDPVELRRRNLIGGHEFPFTAPSGARYDTGAYERALDMALSIARYPELRADQAARRASGDRRLLGIGLACYVEVTASWGSTVSEFGSVSLEPDGSVVVRTGISPHGQGHETSLAQLASEALQVPVEAVRVEHSDTAKLPDGQGTMGSRSLQLGGPAVRRAALVVVEKARRIAGHLLEAGVEDVVLERGRLGIAGAPERSVSWQDVAAAAADPKRLPPGMEPGCASEDRFEQEGGTYPFGTHVAVVEVDADTGLVRLLRHVAVDDAGTLLNPMLAQGQVHGGVAQGVGQALLEEARYDDDGNLLNGNLALYGLPGATELPSYETAHTQTPTPLNPLGAKGIGEAGTIGATPAVWNAVVDALSHLGVRHVPMPLTPERVWRAIRDAARASDDEASRG